MFYTYILQSIKDKSYYIGFTKNLQARIKQHNLGKSKYTKSHTPYELVYFEEFKTAKEAKDREKYIKRYANTAVFLKSRVPQNL